MNKNIQIGLVCFGLLVIGALAFVLLKPSDSLTDSRKQSQGQLQADIQNLEQQELQIDQVSSDDSLNTIEQELSDTIIMDEDFSDL